MKHSLLNPNQYRINSINLCDDLFDKHRNLRIKDIESGLLIPLKFSKYVVGITTRAPTYKEIEEARNAGSLIVMTSGMPWDPSTASVKSFMSLLTLKPPSRLIYENECDHLLESCVAI